MATVRVRALTEITDPANVLDTHNVLVDDASGTRRVQISNFRMAMDGVNVVTIDDTDSPYTLDGTESLLRIDSNTNTVEVQLPSPATFGRRGAVIVQIDGAPANAITLLRASTETINGVAADFDLPGSAATMASGERRAWRLECVSNTAWEVF